MPRWSIMLGMIPLALSGCATNRDARAVSRLMNNPAPDFELTNLDGDQVRLSALRGKPMLLAFFAFG
jgi:cytochrome oxidase Cu insertion factor (SCO1/SenC/PrrC family)